MNIGHLTSVMVALKVNKAIKATKYVDEKTIIRVVEKCYGKKKRKERDNLEWIVTIGKPNYQERQFIKKCRKAKKTFPIKKIQLKFLK